MNLSKIFIMGLDKNRKPDASVITVTDEGFLKYLTLQFHYFEIQDLALH